MKGVYIFAILFVFILNALSVSAGNVEVELNSPGDGIPVNNEVYGVTCTSKSTKILRNVSLYSNFCSSSWKNWTNCDENVFSYKTHVTISFAKLSEYSFLVVRPNQGNHTWNCLATDIEGNSAFAPLNYSYWYDTIEPGLITDIRIDEIGYNFANVSWTNPDDSDLYSVKIEVDGVYYSRVLAPENSFGFVGLVPETTYKFQFRTNDFSNNLHENVTEFNFTTKKYVLDVEEEEQVTESEEDQESDTEPEPRSETDLTTTGQERQSEIDRKSVFDSFSVFAIVAAIAIIILIVVIIILLKHRKHDHRN